MNIGYSYRISRKAKRIIVKMDALGQVVVVLPIGVSPTKVPEVVAQHRDWIKTTRSQVQSARIDNWQTLPDNIHFHFNDCLWKIAYHSAQNCRVIESGERLHIEADLQDLQRVFKQLACWVIHQGKIILEPKIRALSDELRLPINKVSVRNQKTRWGSCSSNKNINLNCRLLFLSPSQVRYLMVHELCHTREMNHSKRFWQLVARYEPNYQALDQSLNASNHLIPHWLFLSNAAGK